MAELLDGLGDQWRRNIADKVRRGGGYCLLAMKLLRRTSVRYQGRGYLGARFSIRITDNACAAEHAAQNAELAGV